MKKIFKKKINKLISKLEDENYRQILVSKDKQKMWKTFSIFELFIIARCLNKKESR